MIIILLSALVGVAIGLLVPWKVPDSYSIYMAIAILAALDSIFGGLLAVLRKKFDLKIFIAGFFGNTFLAVGLVFIGIKLDINLEIAAVVVFGTRLFQNFALIRRFLLKKWTNDDII